MKMLDMGVVQAFVLTTDLKSFTCAAGAMDSTQSAASLKIKRLEDALSRRLLERTPCLVRLSQDDAAFLVVARELVATREGALGAFGAERRRLSVGTSHHIVGARLPRLLHQMGLAKPALTLEIRIASSWEILDVFESGALDAAIVLCHDNRRTDGEVLMEEPFGQIAAPDFEHRTSDPICLVNQADAYCIRQMAAATLENAGIPWQEVFVDGGAAIIGAAAAAGLAVATLSRRVTPPGTVDMGAVLGLPPLPPCSVMPHSRLTDSAAKKALRTSAPTLRATAGRQPITIDADLRNRCAARRLRGDYALPRETAH